MKKVNEDFSCEQVGFVNSESIGSDYREYIVSDDIKIYVATNLGFGNCSYFTLRLQYKGIDILPYSRVVNSYNADMRDVLMFLKKYSPQSDSWNLASDFIESTANLVMTDGEKFCEKFSLCIAVALIFTAQACAFIKLASFIFKIEEFSNNSKYFT